MACVGGASWCGYVVFVVLDEASLERRGTKGKWFDRACCAMRLVGWV